jgi:hypothetical protein
MLQKATFRFSDSACVGHHGLYALGDLTDSFP